MPCPIPFSRAAIAIIERRAITGEGRQLDWEAVEKPVFVGAVASHQEHTFIAMITRAIVLAEMRLDDMIDGVLLFRQSGR